MLSRSMSKPQPKGYFTRKWPPVSNTYPYSRRTLEHEQRKLKANTNPESDHALYTASADTSTSSGSQDAIEAIDSSGNTTLAGQDAQDDAVLSHDNTAMITVPMMIKTKEYDTRWPKLESRPRHRDPAARLRQYVRISHYIRSHNRTYRIQKHTGARVPRRSAPKPRLPTPKRLDSATCKYVPHHRKMKAKSYTLIPTFRSTRSRLSSKPNQDSPFKLFGVGNMSPTLDG